MRAFSAIRHRPVGFDLGGAAWASDGAANLFTFGGSPIELPPWMVVYDATVIASSVCSGGAT
jgi:hypothetical protein